MAFQYWLSRVVLHSLAARLTLRKYCSILLDGENRYLHVPSQHDIKLSVDTIFVTLHLEHHGGEKEAYTHGDLLDTETTESVSWAIPDRERPP